MEEEEKGNLVMRGEFDESADWRVSWRRQKVN